jgi:DNA-dependent RNA polymerase auxiliary subunit epsilon
MIFHVYFQKNHERGSNAMGYEVKIQRVDRGTTKSFYVNFPAALAEAAGIVKGEVWEWSIEDLNTFVITRCKPRKSVRQKKLG